MRAPGILPDTAPGLSTAHNCTLTTYTGGEYAELRPPEKLGKVGGGGIRGHISGFSKASRRRLQRLLAVVDQERQEVPLFVTLTYPGEFPADPAVCAAHLRAFRARMHRRYGKFAAVWRKEYQKRGAPHYHLLLFLDRAPELLRSEVSNIWYEVVGSGDERHLRAGTQVVQVKSWRGARGYAAKYMGKLEMLQPSSGREAEQPVGKTGRLWGVWNRALLPITAEQYYVNLRGYFLIRRCLRRLSHQRTTHRLASMSAFVGHSTALRLLEYSQQPT
jgi:hypothetical protein